jgi:RND family efflux transporter MFP subunit
MTTKTSGSIQQRIRRRGLAMVALLSGLACGCSSSGKVKADDPASAPQVAVVKATRKTISSTLQIASEFQPYQEISVYAKVSGYVQKLYVNWGSHVSQGQLLAVLEIPELQQQLQLDEAAVRRSEQDVARANEELARAQATYTVAHLTYTRLCGVQKNRPELVAQEEVDVAQGKDLEASAGVSAAKDGLAGSEQALAGARAALDRDKALYAYSRITAPFDGVVTELDAYTGALLPAGTASLKGDQALCRLSQNNLLRLVVPLPERALADVHLGETLSVNVSTTHQKFDGKIIRNSDQIDTNTRTMYTEIDVPNPSYSLVPGMYASVDIPLRSVENVVTVPIQAVQLSGANGGRVLIVGTDNKLQERIVAIGIQNATDVEITSGLSENEPVVFGDQSQYQPGELVRPKIVAPSELEKE